MNQSGSCREYIFNNSITSNDCKYKITEFVSGYNVALDLTRLILLVLYFIWIIIAIRLKAFHKRQMMFFYNLVAIGVFHCVTSLWPRLWSSCYIPSLMTCFLVQWTILFGCYYSGYAIGGLIIHRYACIVHHQKITQVKFFSMFLLVLLTWLIPAILSIIHLWSLRNTVFYNTYFGTCFMNTIDRYSDFYFLLVLGNILPVITIIITYIYVHYKLRFMAKNNRRKEPLRVTLKLIILIVTYILSCIGSSLGYYPCFAENSKPIIVHWLRILKLLHHVTALLIVYLHPVLLNIYGRLFK